MVETAANLVPDGDWEPLTNTAQLTNGCWCVNVVPTGVAQYFRLRR